MRKHQKIFAADVGAEISGSADQASSKEGIRRAYFALKPAAATVVVIVPVEMLCDPASTERVTSEAKFVIVRLKVRRFGRPASNLVVSAIVHWNTVYLSRAVQHLRQKRRIIPNDMLKHVSPLSWEHINLTGIYTWDEPPSFADSGFRPLRTPTAIAQAA